MLPHQDSPTALEKIFLLLFSGLSKKGITDDGKQERFMKVSRAEYDLWHEKTKKITPDMRKILKLGAAEM